MGSRRAGGVLLLKHHKVTGEAGARKTAAQQFNRASPPDDAVFKDLIVIVCCNIEGAIFIVFRQLQAHEHLNTLRFPPISAFKQQLLVPLLLRRGCSYF